MRLCVLATQGTPVRVARDGVVYNFAEAQMLEVRGSSVGGG
jgi:hypothetical protein